MTAVSDTKLEMSQLRATTVVRIEPPRSWFSIDLREIWAFRELLYFLIWRDIKIRYKQTVIGAAWAILQPLLTMVVFTLVFERIANVASDGLPYPIFTYSALLPWTLFAGALSRCSISIVSDANLISKTYFPRLITPLAATLSGIVDFGLAFVVLLGMMLWYGIAPTWGVLALPLLVVLVFATALSLGLWLAALHAKYRDVGHAVPFAVQLWMFASPVAYPISEVPESWRTLYTLNPLVGVIEGFRWALLGNESPDVGAMTVGVTIVMVLLAGGLLYFNRTEKTLADVV